MTSIRSLPRANLLNVGQALDNSESPDLDFHTSLNQGRDSLADFERELFGGALTDPKSELMNTPKPSPSDSPPPAPDELSSTPPLNEAQEPRHWTQSSNRAICSRITIERSRTAGRQSLLSSMFGHRFPQTSCFAGDAGRRSKSATLFLTLRLGPTLLPKYKVRERVTH